MKKGLLTSLSAFLLLTLTITSCNKDFERVIAEKDYQDTATVAYGNPKVLYIIADGARGVSVRDANTPNIKSLLPNAIYSWFSLANPDLTTEVNNWADMLTGVRKEKHGVTDLDFTNDHLDKFPLVFDLVKQENPNVKTVAFSSSEVFNTNFTHGTNAHTLLNTDEEVKANVVNNLKTDSASFVVAHFTEVDKAGNQYGFDNSIPEYKAAIEKFDAQVGEVLTALRSRPKYKDENWLVVVTSSTGGAYTLPANQNDNTVFSNTAANTFTIFYAAKYVQKGITKPYTGNRFVGTTVRLFGREGGVHGNVPSNESTEELYNFQDTAGFTIELKIKKNDPRKDGSYRQNYPSVLGKMNEWSGNHPIDNEKGWCIFLEETFWQIYLRGDNGDRRGQQRGQDLGRGTWNHIAAKLEKRNNRRYIRTYTDGVYFGSEMDVTDWGNFKTRAPLTLGFIPGNGHGESDVQVADIRIWRTSLPDAVIKNYACETAVDETHPYYRFLAGYWPGLDASGGEIKDLSPLENHFKLTGSYEWKGFNDLICSPSTAALSNMVPQNADIPAQIISWFRIPRKAIWQLDGRVWLDQ
ncbi:alkaline phosphatase family protein [Desertivirga brevis]|uniref:alkaline phosphatase family protein n=1 Tax=Desertivirga brevis TaxID=2810310 RepID=UPI001A969484|nr:alkaline phosphatase family protein [Pedobacter sp. SYSU D00873]